MALVRLMADFTDACCIFSGVGVVRAAAAVEAGAIAVGSKGEIGVDAAFLAHTHGEGGGKACGERDESLNMPTGITT